MKNTIRVIFPLVGLLFFQILMGQEVLVPIVTWDAGIYTDLRCENRNQSGSDLNNDGFDDYVTITTGDSFVQFYLGGEELEPTFDLELTGVSNSGPPTWGGDLNGDGYKDIVWSKCDAWGQQGDIYICMGGEEIDVEPEMILQEGDISPGCWYIQVLNGGYDFNGDGYDDLLAYGDLDMAFWGVFHIFMGAEEFSTENDYYIQGEMEEQFGYLFAAGDLNGDGYDDLVASRNVDGYQEICLLEVYLGGEDMDMVCDYIIPDTLYSGSYEQIPTGDINGDGRDELIIYSQESSLRTYYIDASGELVAEDYDIVTDGRRIVADINGDGVDDLVCWNQLVEIVAIYYGGDTIGFGYDAYFYVSGCNGQDTSWFICSLGDINGDGEDEILVNNGDGTGSLGTTATVFGLPGNANSECKIENVKCKIDNYPNPFNPETTIRFFTTEGTEGTELNIYNMKGQRVRELRIKNEGLRIHSVVWDGRDDNGHSVSSGVYFARLNFGQQEIISKKMLLMK